MAMSYISVVDRTYKRYRSEDYDNIQFLHHPSGVTVIVLNTELKSRVTQVDFSSSKNKGQNRANNTVVGKGKTGGLLLQKETKLCVIRCEDGSEVVVRAGVKGTLAEINSRLIDQPDLVRTAPENHGYIAIVTYGAGKRKVDEMVTEMPPKKVALRPAPIDKSAPMSGAPQSSLPEDTKPMDSQTQNQVYPIHQPIHQHRRASS